MCELLYLLCLVLADLGNPSDTGYDEKIDILTQAGNDILTPSKMYDSMFQECIRFEHQHQWWSHNTWFLPDNQTLKEFVESQIRSDVSIQNLIKQGTNDDITQFYEKLKDVSPLISTAVMKGILNVCYREEKLDGQFSKDIVKWFRAMGWKFPDFTFEKIEIETSAQENIQITVEMKTETNVS